MTDDEIKEREFLTARVQQLEDEGRAKDAQIADLEAKVNLPEVQAAALAQKKRDRAALAAVVAQLDADIGAGDQAASALPAQAATPAKV